MKSNKLIAFFCSAAMAITSVSGVFASAKAPADDKLVVSADAIEKGYDLVFDSANSTATEKIIAVYAVGYDSVKSGSVSFDVPDDVASKITAVAAVDEEGLFPGVTITDLDTVKDSKFLGGAFAAAKTQSSEDMLLFKFDITLSEDIAEDWELSVIEDATIEDANGEYFLEDKDFGVSTDTVTVWTDPNATPVPSTPTPTDPPVEKGYKLSFDEANSTATEKIVAVYAVGYDAVKSGSISFNVSDDVASKITAVAAADEEGLFPGVTITDLDTIKDSKFLGGAFAAAKTQSSEDMLLFKFVITLSEDITEDWYLSVIEDATIEDADGEYFLEDKDFGVQSDTVTAYSTSEPTTVPTTGPTTAPTDPPTPKPTEIVKERKTPVPATSAPTTEPTTAPKATDAPVEKGYKLSFDEANSTATEKIVAVYAVGYDAVKSGSISFNVSDDVASKITAVAAADEEGLFPGVTITDLDTIKDSKFLGGAFAAAKTQSSEDMLLFKFVITVSEDITEDWYLSVIEDATIEDADGEYFLEDKDFGVQSDTVTAYSTSEPTTVPTTAPTAEPFDGDDEVYLEDILDPENPETVKGVHVKVTKNGSDAEYGTDYVAVLDGHELTEEEFENIQNGLTPDGTAYEEDVVNNIINKLSIKAVNGTSVEVAPAYLNESGQLVVDPDDIVKEEIATDAPSSNVTVTFYDEDGEIVDIITVTKGGKIRTADMPTIPAKQGYTGKWVVLGSGVTFSSSTVINEDMYIEPKYSKKADGGSGGGSGNSSSGSSSGGNMIATSPSSNVPGNAVVAPVFTDLETVPWAVSAINTLATAGIVNGVNDSNTLYEPLFNVTRAQFTKMICVTFNIPQASPEASRFTDVPWYSWYIGWVEAAADAGIVQGVSDTEFDPEANITREQMATMLYRAILSKGGNLDGEASAVFTDAAQISDYAVAPINALVKAGVVQGRDDGSFGPKDLANRAEAACIIYQYLIAGIK